MKKSILTTTLLLGFAMMSSAQSAPKKVTDAFNLKFEKAEFVEWELEESSDWEAVFEMDGLLFEAVFTKDGDWKETEYEIEASRLPKGVQNTLKTKYAKYEVYASLVEETVANKTYKIEIGNDEETVSLILNEAGIVLKSDLEKFENQEEDY